MTTTRAYKRHGITDLFSVVKVATDEVLCEMRRLHKATDALALFKPIDFHVPRHLEVDVVPNNLSAHKAEPIATWLAASKTRPVASALQATFSSWLNRSKGGSRFSQNADCDVAPSARSTTLSPLSRHGHSKGTMIQNPSSGRRRPRRERLEREPGSLDMGFSQICDARLAKPPSEGKIAWRQILDSDTFQTDTGQNATNAQRRAILQEYSQR